MAKARRLAMMAVLTAVFCSLVAVMAQEKTSSQGGEMPPKPKPGIEMEKLYFQVGNWKVIEKHESGPGFSGGQGQGAIKSRKGPGGLSVETDYASKGPIGEFAGKGIVAWNAEDRVYRSYWFDNFQAGALETTGRWEGNDLVFTGAYKMMGQQYQWKQVYTDITPTSYTSKIYMAGEDNRMMMVLTLKATKQ